MASGIRHPATGNADIFYIRPFQSLYVTMSLRHYVTTPLFPMPSRPSVRDSASLRMPYAITPLRHYVTTPLFSP